MKLSPSFCPTQFFSCIVVTAVLAAQAVAASLGGTVFYGTTGVSSGLVSAYQIGTGRKAVTLTNSSGAYFFNSLPVGGYVVFVEKDGRKIYQGRVDVRQNSTRFDIRL